MRQMVATENTIMKYYYYFEIDTNRLWRENVFQPVVSGTTRSRIYRWWHKKECPISKPFVNFSMFWLNPKKKDVHLVFSLTHCLLPGNVFCLLRFIWCLPNKPYKEEEACPNIISVSNLNFNLHVTFVLQTIRVIIIILSVSH